MNDDDDGDSASDCCCKSIVGNRQQANDNGRRRWDEMRWARRQAAADVRRLIVCQVRREIYTLIHMWRGYWEAGGSRSILCPWPPGPLWCHNSFNPSATSSWVEWGWLVGWPLDTSQGINIISQQPPADEGLILDVHQPYNYWYCSLSQSVSQSVSSPHCIRWTGVPNEL